MKTQPVVAEKFHAVRWKAGVERQTDGRRGRMELIIAFCNFSNAPKNVYRYL